ncbi:hypothetical protein H5410_045872 [Solanum commersonii]|uniref:K Homology domain-containing protein n=1 Tax=Solanum commersonii TaxID=4109 RepID=A0A9J5XE08_SOLCO|nr:hypothetical protein H5410_045872 [Solanum commersonii]
MDAALRIFKCIAGPNNDYRGEVAACAAFYSSRLLVASSQAIHLIGRHGSTIKSIQERLVTTLRVLSAGDIYRTTRKRNKDDVVVDRNAIGVPAPKMLSFMSKNGGDEYDVVSLVTSYI